MKILFDIGGTNTRLALAKEDKVSGFQIYDTPDNFEDLLKIRPVPIY